MSYKLTTLNLFTAKGGNYPKYQSLRKCSKYIYWRSEECELDLFNMSDCAEMFTSSQNYYYNLRTFPPRKPNFIQL